MKKNRGRERRNASRQASESSRNARGSLNQSRAGNTDLKNFGKNIL